MTRKFLTSRPMITKVVSLVLLTASTAASARAACPSQGGQGSKSCNVGGNFGGGGVPQVPRIGNLPPLAAGSNYPMVVDGVVSKQSQPIKILSTTGERQVVTIPTPLVAPSDVSPLATMADALARR